MKKTNYFIGVLALMILMLSVFVSADGIQTITVTAPNGFVNNITGTYEARGNMTLDADGLFNNAKDFNVTLYIGAGLGSSLCTNSTLKNDTYWICKIDTTSFTDNQSLLINVTYGNNSITGVNSTSTTTLLDNSAPTVSLARLSSLQTDKSGFYPVGCDVNDNVDRNINVRINAIDDGSVNTTNQLNTEDASGTPINNSLEFANGEFQTAGLYTLRCTATTSTSLATSGTATFNVKSDRGGIAISQAVVQEKQGAVSSTVIIVIFVIIAFLLLSTTALYFTMKK